MSVTSRDQMLQNGQFSAWVTLEGTCRTVYEPKTTLGRNGTETSGWIASEEGKVCLQYLTKDTLSHSSFRSSL